MQLKTKLYQDMFIDRMNLLKGFATPGQKHGIMVELWKQEKAWLDSMDSEYDEIMQAQEIADRSV